MTQVSNYSLVVFEHLSNTDFYDINIYFFRKHKAPALFAFLFDNLYISYIRQIKYHSPRTSFSCVFACFFYFDKSAISVLDHIGMYPVICARCYFKCVPYIIANINEQVRAGADDETHKLNEIHEYEN